MYEAKGWPQMPFVFYPPNGSTPLLAIPPPIIPAIISSNRRSMLDRKMRRKAETHKTIPCRAWTDTGRCNYGNKCKFAHGEEDLRKLPPEPVKVYNNPRYRTAPCLKYRLLGSCPYGDRCSYIHEPVPKVDIERCLEQLSPPSSPTHSIDTDSTGDEWCRTMTSTPISNDPFMTEDSGKATIEFPKFEALEGLENFLQKPFSFF
uniref:Zinc finger protein n=1 Tax=Ascaris lumbricoides TaxID=6252 RepID=A0A0M3ILA9_ASCLU